MSMTIHMPLAKVFDLIQYNREIIDGLTAELTATNRRMKSGEFNAEVIQRSFAHLTLTKAESIRNADNSATIAMTFADDGEAALFKLKYR